MFNLFRKIRQKRDVVSLDEPTRTYTRVSEIAKRLGYSADVVYRYLDEHSIQTVDMLGDDFIEDSFAEKIVWNIRLEMKRECSHCGKVFLPKKDGETYCSKRACQKASQVIAFD